MSNEVSDFLRSVEQLNSSRDEDEEARSRELEEKLLQQRKERQARREERARSISPQKSSPANTPPPSSRRKDSTSQVTEDRPSSPIPALSAALQNQTTTITSPPSETMDLSSARPTSPIKETVLGHEPKRTSISSSPSSAMSTKTPALSWQRRPPSQGPDRPRSRPLSIVAAENAAARSSNNTPAEAASPDHAPSRDQISEALGSKDPAWFHQTADRGANSAAYRRNHVEDVDTVDLSSAHAKLPGMSQPTSTEPEKEPKRERPASQASSGTLTSPLPMTEAQKLGPPADIQTDHEGSASGSSSPTRSASPTKGMGGFVQSAMMKRTDSVKRWSITAPGLQRGGNRNSFDIKGGPTSPGPESSPRPASRSRESRSRPTSSHARDLPPADETSQKDSAPAPEVEPVDDSTLPTTPSRTMDTKRWSPTKGSWLDAALNKPESPKPKTAVPSNQPAWMVELNKAKAERAKNASIDIGRAGTATKKHEVKTGGLVRPAPLGTAVKPSSFNGLPSPSLAGEKPLTPGLRGSFPKTSPALDKPSLSTEEPARRGSVTSPALPAAEPEKPEVPLKSDFRAALRPRSTTIGKEEIMESGRRDSHTIPTFPALPVLDQEKTEPLKKDFRAGLRPRGATIGKDIRKEENKEEAQPGPVSPTVPAVPEVPALEQEKPEAALKNGFRAGLRPRGLTLGKEEVKEPVRRGSVSPLLEQEKPETPTPTKKDFRAGLRARGTTIGKEPLGREESREPGNELANVFGKLRRAKTQNFVAPDELKDNILKGKSALNTTGGPKPYEKKDEFKDAILKKKADFQQAKEEGRSISPTAKVSQEQPIPEGLAKRASLSRPNSVSQYSHSRDTSAAKSPSEASAKAFQSSRSSMLSATSPPTTNEEASIKEESTPVKEEPSPFKEEPSPVKEEPTPVKEEPSPVKEEPTPAQEEKAIEAPVSSLPKEKSVLNRLSNRFGVEKADEASSPILPKEKSVLGRLPNKFGGEKADEASLPIFPKETGVSGRLPNKFGGEKADEAPLSSVPKEKSVLNRLSNRFGAEKVDEASSPILPKEKSVPGRLPNKLGGNGLAGRFNPALAGILARGPPGVGGAATKPPGTSSDADQEPKPAPKLEHMTKGRARGPRRKAPTSVTKSAETVDSVPGESAQPEPAQPTEPDVPTEPTEPAAPAAPLSLVPKNKEPVAKEVEAEKALPPTPAQEPEPKPVVPPKPIPKSPTLSRVEQFKVAMAKDQPRELSSVSLKSSPEQQPISTGTDNPLMDSSRPKVATPTSPNKIHDQVAAVPAEPQPAEEKVDEHLPSPRKLDNRRMSKFLDEASLPAAKSEPEPVRSPSPTKKSFGGPMGPRKLPGSEKADSQPAVSMGYGATRLGRSITPTKPLPTTPAKEVVPEPLNLRRKSTAKTPTSRELPPLPSTSAQASPVASPSRPLPSRSLSKSAGDVSAMLNGFFGNDRPKRNYRVDAVEVLMNRSKSGSIVRTQKAQLFQMTEQGKKIPVPSHQERVLFEREMYLCPHTFTNEAGKKISEVYFWAGDEVAPSVIEDAHVFVNKEARSMGGTLINMHQGKETAEFIQALGGIVIIRRGSSNKYDSLAPNILCGRQYMGQIVFDEVDFAPNTLCSGFPYLITQQGKCYLWKGKGSGIDEVSCAKLVGMDLALMGELIDIEEGQEPDDFWHLFGGARKMSSADHWKLKPSYDKYCGRLFCSDTADQRQIVEINPFSQSDLSPGKIYVLDAFFEMYIIIGREAQSQYASFHNALDFAQEYAILAAGMEDRPFVPVSTVVLEGIPRDLRSCFRKWRDDKSPTKMLPSSSNTAAPVSAGGAKPAGLKRARSLKVLPLGQALQALGNSE